MFRPNTGIDLNDFPALGAAPNGRPSTGTLPSQSSLLSNSRFSNYLPSSNLADTAFMSNAEFGASSPYRSRNFSMDEFPALQRSPTAAAPMAPLTPSSSDLKGGAAEPWDYSSSSSFPNNNHGGVKNDPWSRGHVAPPPASATKRAFAPTPAPPALSSSSSSKASPSAARSTVQGGSSSVSSISSATAAAAATTTTTTGGIDGKQDPYGLLGLLGVIRMTEPDRSMLALGSDLTTLGLDLNAPDSIYSTFISPWSDTQTPSGLNVEPGYYLPPCYRSVQAKPPAHQRMRAFSDEILFCAFYATPRDITQEAAAQELYGRGWRYHKELGMWMFKEADENGRPVQGFRRTSPDPMDRGVYVIFDPNSWSKVKREWALPWDALEDRQQQQQQSGLPPMSSSSSSSSSMQQQQQQHPRAQPGMGMMTPPPSGISPGMSSSLMI